MATNDSHLQPSSDVATVVAASSSSDAAPSDPPHSPPNRLLTIWSIVHLKKIASRLVHRTRTKPTHSLSPSPFFGRTRSHHTTHTLHAQEEQPPPTHPPSHHNQPSPPSSPPPPPASPLAPGVPVPLPHDPPQEHVAPVVLSPSSQAELTTTTGRVVADDNPTLNLEPGAAPAVQQADLTDAAAAFGRKFPDSPPPEHRPEPSEPWEPSEPSDPGLGLAFAAVTAAAAPGLASVARASDTAPEPQNTLPPNAGSHSATDDAHPNTHSFEMDHVRPYLQQQHHQQQQLDYEGSPIAGADTTSAALRQTPTMQFSASGPDQVREEACFENFVRGCEEDPSNASGSIYAYGRDNISCGSGFDRVPSRTGLDRWSSPHTVPAPLINVNFVNAEVDTVHDIGLASQVKDDIPDQGADDPQTGHPNHEEPIVEDLSVVRHDTTTAGVVEEQSLCLDNLKPVGSPPVSGKALSSFSADSPLSTDDRLRRTASRVGSPTPNIDGQPVSPQDGGGPQMVVHNVDLPEDATNLWVIGRYVVPW